MPKTLSQAQAIGAHALTDAGFSTSDTRIWTHPDGRAGMLVFEPDAQRQGIARVKLRTLGGEATLVSFV